MKAFKYCRKKLDFRWYQEAGFCYSEYDFTITVENVYVMNSFWPYYGQTKISFTKPEPLSTSKMEPFLTIIDSWKLLTSVVSSLDPSWLHYDSQRTEECCSNVNSLVVYVNGGRPIFVFVSNPKCNQDFNETILETLSMPENVLRMLTFSVMSVLLLGLHEVLPSILKQEFY